MRRKRNFWTLREPSAAEADRFLMLFPSDRHKCRSPCASGSREFGNRSRIAPPRQRPPPPRITFRAKDMPLVECAEGNRKANRQRFIDNRDQGGGPAGTKDAIASTSNSKTNLFGRRSIKSSIRAKLGIYSYGGKDAPLDRAARRGRRRRAQAGRYSGPFRLDITRCPGRAQSPATQADVAQAAIGSCLGTATAADRHLAAGRGSEGCDRCAAAI